MLDGGHLVIDHVEVEDADGILLLLPAPQPGVAGVAAGGHLGVIVNFLNICQHYYCQHINHFQHCNYHHQLKAYFRENLTHWVHRCVESALLYR